MRRMGGLWSKLRITGPTFLIGAIAISGIPPLSGFWSKDEILAEAYGAGHGVIWVVGMITALLTALYMFRLIFLTFFGRSRLDREVEAHVHESPPSMTVPLVFLALMSVIAGFVGYGGKESLFHSFLGHVFEEGHGLSEVGHAGLSEGTLMVLSVLFGVIGIVVAWTVYLKRKPDPERVAQRSGPLYVLLSHKYYVDEIYDAVVVNPMKRGSFFLWEIFDTLVVDGIVNGIGVLVRGVSWVVSQLQTGYVYLYALTMVMGMIVIVYFVIW